LGQAELFGKALVSGCRFEGADILALNVLHERDFEHLAVGKLPHDDGHFGQPRLLRRPPPALPAHQLVAVLCSARDEGLKHSMGADGLGEFRQFHGIEDRAGLEGVRLDVGRFQANLRRVA
jgi:hypothetical protein